MLAQMKAGTAMCHFGNCKLKDVARLNAEEVCPEGKENDVSCAKGVSMSG